MFSERGSLTVQELIGLGVDALATCLVALIANYAVPLVHDLYVSWQGTTAVASVQGQIDTYSPAAAAWFIPTLDVYGNAQPSGGGSPGATGLVQLPANAPQEIDVAIKTNTGVTGTYLFYAFRYNGVTSALEKIPYYSRRRSGVALCSANTPCSAANTAVAESWSAKSCGMGSLLASQIPSIDPLVAQLAVGKTIPDVSYPIGFSPDVQSSNKLYAIQCDFTPGLWVAQTTAGDNYFQQQFQMTAGETVSPFSVPVSYTPPPIGGMALQVNPNPITLGYAGANGLPSSGTIDASVTNYHHNIVLDGTTISATGQVAGCSGIANLTLGALTRSASGSANSPPTTFPGTWMQFAVAPAAVGRCTATFSTESGLLAPDNVVQQTTAQIVVEGQLTVLPTSLTFASPTAASQSVSISEPGYFGTFQVSGCGGFASTGSPGSGPSSSMTVSPAAATSPTCTVTVTDGNGASGSVVVTVLNVPMQTWPIAVRYAVAGQTLASVNRQEPIDIAGLIFGVARAAGACGAIAYKDKGFTIADAGNNTFASLGISTDANGCYSGSVVAYEPGGGNSSFNIQSNACPSSALTNNLWTSQPAIMSALGMSAGSSAVDTCNITLQDTSNSGKGTSGFGLVVASVVGTCQNNDILALGSSCFFQPLLDSGDPDCEETASWDGFTGLYKLQIKSGNATISGLDMITRTATGPITIAVSEQRISIGVWPNCKPNSPSYSWIAGPDSPETIN